MQQPPKRSEPERHPSLCRPQSCGGSPEDANRCASLANLSGVPQVEYFGDGLAEELTNVLAQIGSLKVIARTSAFAFKGKNEGIRKIADSLGVTHVLVGSVPRLGVRMRVTAQFTHASDGAHIFSKRYDCQQTDLFALQDEISADTARQFRAHLKEHKAASHHPEAYQAFLEGRIYWRKLTPAARGVIEILGPSHLSLFTLGPAQAAAGDTSGVDQVVALPRGHAGSPTAIASMPCS